MEERIVDPIVAKVLRLITETQLKIQLNIKTHNWALEIRYCHLSLYSIMAHTKNNMKDL
jgi:hypothetical protein